jgi:hypothetical protein
LENRYPDFCQEQIRTHMIAMGPEIRTDLLAVKLRLVRKQWEHLPKETIEQIATRQLENDIRDGLTLPSVEEFAWRNPQQSLFD